MGRIFLLGCLMIVSLLAQAGDLYRWVDAKGKPQYGDNPPPGAVMVETLGFHDKAAADAGLPYETRRALKEFPVTLYTAEDCGELCGQARDLLGKRGIPYAEKKLVTKEEIDAFKALSGSLIAPTLGVGRNFLKGFEAGQWNNELDIAGYPKVAPYHPSVGGPAAASAVVPAETVPTGNAAQ